MKMKLHSISLFNFKFMTTSPVFSIYCLYNLQKHTLTNKKCDNLPQAFLAIFMCTYKQNKKSVKKLSLSSRPSLSLL